MSEPWCVILAGREERLRPAITAIGHRDEESSPAPSQRDPLSETVRRAAAVARGDHIAAVISGAAPRRGPPAEDVSWFSQPEHRGTAYEVLLALLLLEKRISPATPILFLPADHVVSDEEVMTSSLKSMAEWIGNEPRPVYLLGAVPQGPHDQLGYIVPWHDTPLMPVGVYEFVEMPDSSRARRLISAGALWNTFIFGGTADSLMKLFPLSFTATIAALRSALQADPIDQRALKSIYEYLRPVDFSEALLATQTDQLHVIRLPRCGWWPLKPPTVHRRLHGSALLTANRIHYPHKFNS